MPTGEQNYYQRLGVAADATAVQIKQAYRARVMETHPDLHRDADPARFQRIKRAYETLANPHERRQYDMLTGLGSEPPRRCVYRRSFERLFSSLFLGLRVTVLAVPDLAESRRKAG